VSLPARLADRECIGGGVVPGRVRRQVCGRSASSDWLARDIAIRVEARAMAGALKGAADDVRFAALVRADRGDRGERRRASALYRDQADLRRDLHELSSDIETRDRTHLERDGVRGLLQRCGSELAVATTGDERGGTGGG